MMVLRSPISFIAMFVLTIFSLVSLVESAPLIKRSPAPGLEFVSPVWNTAVSAAGTVKVQVRIHDGLPFSTQVKLESSYPAPGPRGAPIISTLGTWTAGELETNGQEVKVTKRDLPQAIIASWQYKGVADSVQSENFHY